jgi:hypothetical protein
VKRLAFALSGILLCSGISMAQNTTVSATLVDTDGTVWTGASWELTFNPNPVQPNAAVYNMSGAPLDPAVTTQKGAANGTGVMFFTSFDNSFITPSGSSWTLKVCPKASAACGVYKFSCNR